MWKVLAALVTMCAVFTVIAGQGNSSSTEAPTTTTTTTNATEAPAVTTTTTVKPDVTFSTASVETTTRAGAPSVVNSSVLPVLLGVYAVMSLLIN
ncbi:location of vulva defective 1-like [Anopheles moucheti]|uniref:location of vulva defective 1-like n=1 Tax=Anopheles moucheti TaxID=186751 RepID=UPI0022F0E448|nr:location of vulva defective 1-like [Anopheles moucheti]